MEKWNLARRDSQGFIINYHRYDRQSERDIKIAKGLAAGDTNKIGFLFYSTHPHVSHRCNG